MSLEINTNMEILAAGTSRSTEANEAAEPAPDEAIQKELQKPVNPFEEATDAELARLQKKIESAIKDIEEGIAYIEKKNPKSPNLPKYKKRLKELKAEYKRIIDELKAREEEDKKKLDTRW